ncbi:MAG TPA: tetratricopeptide repeat protein [Pirellulales bacterium]|nr:tetratricopeptide repeat protein [Pirellulales bacterium]
MPQPTPPLDEHGFPIPPTFDGHVHRRRPGELFGGAWKFGLVLAFMGLLAGWLWKSDAASGAKQLVARRLLARAVDKYQAGDLNGAMADLDRALSWSPDDAGIFRVRAKIRLESNDVDGSLADFDQLIRLSPRYAQAYLDRSQVYQRLDRHREAIDDLSKAISLSPSGDPTPRNNRAYARALANVELDEALVDVQQALDIVDQQIADTERVLPGTDAALQYKVQKAAYLDTRGYIHFLQGNYEPARDDLNQAIELAQQGLDAALPLVPAPRRAATQTQFNHEMAVMYHHRGEVFAKLGQQDAAKSDLDRGDQLGYNPAAGVF